MDSFEIVNMPKTGEKSSEQVSEAKLCSVCLETCKLHHVVCQSRFIVTLKFKEPICCNCHNFKESQIQEFMKEISAKLGYELEYKEQKEFEGFGSNCRSIEDNTPKVSVNAIKKGVSQIRSLCSRCCCYSEDDMCSICIEGSFKCEGSCTCCKGRSDETRKKDSDDGIEVLHEE